MNIYIKSVKGREILDSRGNPTVEAEIELSDGSIGRGIAPSGASTGKFEAWELRDNDVKRYGGKGVRDAVDNINEKIAKKLLGVETDDVYDIDRILFEIDGTKEKKKIGANAILAVSMAFSYAAAASQGIELFRYLGGVSGNTMPIPMMNILNGGAHSSNTIDIQEFMIMPLGACCFKEGMRWCCEVYQTLKKELEKRGLSTAVGDEGGFAPDLKDEDEVLDIIVASIEAAGYKAGKGKDFMIALDVAASEWKDREERTGYYYLPKAGKEYSTAELIDRWEQLVQKYPIYSLEDPLDEEDWNGWKELTTRIGEQVYLVGDDLFVTNIERLENGIVNKCGNSILIKPNQIGSVSETIETVKKAKMNGFKTIMSHRSGETEDTFIADLAVALNTGLIKTGAPSRGERTAKYNRLLRIEEKVNGSI